MKAFELKRMQERVTEEINLIFFLNFPEKVPYADKVMHFFTNDI